MKEISQFKCDVCGKIFSDKYKCDKHERSHGLPVKITRAAHNRAIETSRGLFPAEITLEFSNGSWANYRWDGFALKPQE